MTPETTGTTQTDQIHQIAIAEIDRDALPRDRTTEDPSRYDLECSILTQGLRMPIEVFERADPKGPFLYGLISGHRRLSACEALGHDTIAAFLRRPRDNATALAAMVAENEMREQISAWEKGRLLNRVLCEGFYPTEDAALDSLFPSASRQKRARLRSIVLVVSEFDGRLNEAETLSVARIEHLATALRLGFGDLIHAALLPLGRKASLATQWTAIAPILAEGFSAEEAPISARSPRRMIQPRTGLTLRRELTRGGYAIHITGKLARSPGLVDDIFELVERMVGVRE